METPSRLQLPINTGVTDTRDGSHARGDRKRNGIPKTRRLFITATFRDAPRYAITVCRVCSLARTRCVPFKTQKYTVPNAPVRDYRAFGISERNSRKCCNDSSRRSPLPFDELSSRRGALTSRNRFRELANRAYSGRVSESFHFAPIVTVGRVRATRPSNRVRISRERKVQTTETRL